nr:hypothetical protein [Bacteroidota bacterium]
MLKFLKVSFLFLFIPSLSNAQIEGFTAVGIGINAMVNNTFSMENEIGLNRLFSINGTIGLTAQKKLGQMETEINAVSNGVFLRLGPRLNKYIDKNSRLYFDANLIFSRFSQDYKLEIADF